MPWIAHIDGGSRGNPGPAAAGVVLRDDAGQIVLSAGFFLGRKTNNQAEYQGLLNALKLFHKAGARQVEIVSDSELMVRQINGQYKVRSPDLRPLYEEAMALLKSLKWRIRHTLREGNTDADALANAAMDEGGDVIQQDTRGLLASPGKPAPAASIPAPAQTPAVEGRLVVPPAQGKCEADLQRGEAFPFEAFTPTGLCLHLCAAAVPAVLEMQQAPSPPERRVRCGKPGCGAVLELKPKL